MFSKSSSFVLNCLVFASSQKLDFFFLIVILLISLLFIYLFFYGS